MRFRCETKQLLKGVLLISNLCQTKSTKPILQDIKIDVKKSEVQLLGTDLEVAIRYHLLEIDISDTGTVVVPALKLLNMLREIRDESVEISTDTRVCSIHSEDAKFKLIGDDHDEFPIIPEYDFKDALSIKSNELTSYANKTLFSVAKDMSCYAYNGILIEIYEEGIKLVATDGRRLAVAGNVDKDQENLLSTSVVPVKGIVQLIRSVEDEEGDISIKPYKNQFIMKTKHAEIAARLLEGDFPKYKDVIPSNNENVIKVNKEDLLSAVKKVAITAGNEVRSVQFIYLPKTLKLFSQQEGIGESQAELGIDYDGDKFEITFNPDFIMDYLKVIESDEVPFCFKDENSSCLIEDNSREFYIVMPITSK